MWLSHLFRRVFIASHKKKAAMIAVRTVNDFIEENSGSLDLVEWILFDEETLNIYKDALNQFKANKIVGTPGF